MFNYQYTASGDVIRSDGVGMSATNSEVTEWEATGNVITPYTPTVQTPGQLKADAQSAIDAQLAALDIKRIRPTAEGDATYLATLNAQAVALRAQRTAL